MTSSKTILSLLLVAGGVLTLTLLLAGAPIDIRGIISGDRCPCNKRRQFDPIEWKDAGTAQTKPFEHRMGMIGDLVRTIPLIGTEESMLWSHLGPPEARESSGDQTSVGYILGNDRCASVFGRSRVYLKLTLRGGRCIGYSTNLGGRSIHSGE